MPIPIGIIPDKKPFIANKPNGLPNRIELVWGKNSHLYIVNHDLGNGKTDTIRGHNNLNKFRFVEFSLPADLDRIRTTALKHKSAHQREGIRPCMCYNCRTDAALRGEQ